MTKTEKTKKRKPYYDVMIVLGAIWFIVGFLIYQKPILWPLGIIFLIAGFAGKLGKNRNVKE